MAANIISRSLNIYFPTLRNRAVIISREMASFNVRKEYPQKHLFDLNELNVYETNVINLSAGTPGRDLLQDCCELFKVATDHQMEFELKNNSYLFQYGPVDGSQIFRTQLSEFLSKSYESKVESADLVLTSGATNGLHHVLTTLVDQDGYVFLDEVTYMIALEAISQFSNIKVISVKLNDNGVDLKDLEEKIQAKQFKSKNKLFWATYYTIPTFHNPTGILFSEDVNRSLIKIARKYDFLVTCDDVYNLLPFGNAKPPKRLFAYDSFDDEDFKGNVVSNGTFSKILAPGVRIGWIEAGPRIVKALRGSGVLKSGGAVNNYTSGLIGRLIELGLAEKQLKKCLDTYEAQCNALCDTLDEFLPKSCTFTRPQGGYFVWIKLPEHVDGDALSEHCLKNFKVFAIRGSRFSFDKQAKNFIRLSFALHNPEVLRKGGELVCKGIIDFLSRSGQN